MSTIRELIGDEQSIVAVDRAVLASVLLALVILGGWELADSAADLQDRASRGLMRADAGGGPAPA